MFKPVVTFQDSCINLGERANYDETGASSTVTQNYVTTTWTHDTVTLAAFASELGTAPTLEFAYLPIEGSFTKDTPVQVTSVISPASNTFQQHQVPADTEILQYTTFYRQKGCEFAGCEMNSAENHLLVVTKDQESWVNFVVHLNTFDIKIVKEGWNALEPGQSYIFNVIGPNGSNIDLDVMINQNGHVILKGVPVGTYTVKEDTNWSWRYDPKGGAEKTVSASSAVDGMATVTFENERNDIYWLDGNAYVSNVFGKAS